MLGADDQRRLRSSSAIRDDLREQGTPTHARDEDALRGSLLIPLENIAPGRALSAQQRPVSVTAQMYFRFSEKHEPPTTTTTVNAKPTLFPGCDRPAHPAQLVVLLLAGSKYYLPTTKN